jgi:gliding motility-associated-like protein
MVGNLIMLSAWSQTSLFYNNGASVYMMPGSYMIVNNDSLHNYLGLIQNGGDLRVAGDIYNDPTATLTGNPSGPTGLYDIGGNWVNSGIVTSFQDSVMLNGDARGSSGPSGNQLITGNSVTTFHNLILAGTANSVKTQTLDAKVDGILDLRNNELATQQYEMLVLNTSPGAVIKNNLNSPDGYVSSTDVGRLSRTTNSTSTYLYPVGIPSSLVTATYPFYYRPLEMTPVSTTQNVYGTRLVDNPTADTYDVLQFDDTLCSVNPHFYHRIYHTTGGNAAAITMYFDPTSDGYWTDMAHWGVPHTTEWNYMGQPNTGSNYGFSSIQIPNWSNFTKYPFALASKKFYVNAGPDQDVYANQTVSLNASISTVNINTISWTPDLFLNDNTIADPTAVPTSNVEYVVTVVDKSGCVIRDSVKLTLLPDALLIPTAFSPNGDGVNDLFRPLNKNLNKLVFMVFDRWGEKVYETDVIGDGWNGTYKGRKQDLGVYVWQAQYQLTGQTKTFSESGNVTLVR